MTIDERVEAILSDIHDPTLYMTHRQEFEAIKRAIESAVAEEREACAKVADEEKKRAAQSTDFYRRDYGCDAASGIASNIRARGAK